MNVTFWGVRGSIPAPGPGTLRYGGNTPCVSVRLPSGAQVIFDCGTGARMLGNALCNQEFGTGAGRATIALSISEWDHIQGFPFFRPLFIAGNQFTVYGPSPDPARLEAILEGQMAAQYFPVQTIKNMAASIELRALPDDEPVDVGGALLTAAQTVADPSHQHGAVKLGARAFRLEEAGRSLVYVGHASYGPSGESPAVVKLCAGATVLIHECSFSPDDWRRYPHRGLASLQHAVATALAARVARLVLIHYDQDYSDQEVDALVVRARALVAQSGGDLEVIAAVEQDSLLV